MWQLEKLWLDHLKIWSAKVWFLPFFTPRHSHTFCVFSPGASQVETQQPTQVGCLTTQGCDHIPGLLGKSWDLSKDVHVSSARQQERPLNTASAGEPTAARKLRVLLALLTIDMLNTQGNSSLFLSLSCAHTHTHMDSHHQLGTLHAKNKTKQTKKKQHLSSHTHNRKQARRFRTNTHTHAQTLATQRHLHVRVPCQHFLTLTIQHFFATVQQRRVNNARCDNARIQAACRNGSVYSLGGGRDPGGREGVSGGQGRSDSEGHRGLAFHYETGVKLLLPIFFHLLSRGGQTFRLMGSQLVRNIEGPKQKQVDGVFWWPNLIGGKNNISYICVMPMLYFMNYLFTLVGCIVIF